MPVSTPPGRIPVLVAAGLLAALHLLRRAGIDPAALAYNPAHVADGEWWRLVTHPFVHLNTYHLLIDGSVFLALLPLLERHHTRAIALLGIGSLLGATASAHDLSAIGFCGLSGIGHGMVALVAARWLLSGSHRVGGAVFLALVLAKSSWEVATGGVVFSGLHLGPVGQPIVTCHLGGAVMGLVLACAELFPWRKLPLALATAAGTGVAQSQEAGDAAVLDLFERRCAECHGPGDEEPPLHAGISLAELRTDDAYVVAGQANRSPLFREVARRRMPKSRGEPGGARYRAALTPAELDLLRRWIQGPSDIAPRPFIAQAEVERRVLRDLETLPPAARRDSRYLSLAALWNRLPARVSATDLDSHRAAIGKLVNSLSWRPDIRVPARADPDGVVLRLRLSDYGWTPAQWRRLAGATPYALRTGRPAARAVAAQTGTELPILRADWFCFAAAQPPFYHELLGLPDTDLELESQLGLSLVRNLQRGRALRAGFQRSGVSGANRLIERHEIRGGAYWKSYDFRADALPGDNAAERRTDLFQHPLGPPGAGLAADDLAFRHDGGEIIFHLPNGLQAYLLTTAAGDRLDRAPVDIVQDRNRRDGVIVNGISCLRCHADGTRPPPGGAHDEVGPVALSTLPLTRAERLLAKALHPGDAALAEALQRDADRFRAASLRATGGLAPEREPIGALYGFHAAAVGRADLEAEFGLPLASLERAFRTVGSPAHRALAQRLSQDIAIPRAAFAAAYGALAEAATLDPVAPRIQITFAEHGEASIEALRDNPPSYSGPGTGLHHRMANPAAQDFWGAPRKTGALEDRR